MSNYDLQIISRHPQFNGKPLRKYQVEGIETIGVWGEEEFEIQFKNNTWQKVCVKVSIDGIDIMTGEPATTCSSDKMWVVNAYDTLKLKAWPETDQGGAYFIFTNADNSVSVHIHGDQFSRGIIAACIFTEGHIEPNQWTIITQPIIYPYPIPQPQPYNPWAYPNYWTTNTNGNFGRGSSSQSFGANTNNLPTVYNSFSSNATTTTTGYLNAEPLESVAGVGAGQYTEQAITYTAGLIKPILAETIRVRYIWWDSLVEKLRTETVPQAQPSGFPGNKTRGIDLGSTPRIGQKKTVSRVSEPVFARV